MSDSPRIAVHTQVSLQYALATANGTVIRQAHEKPIQYIHGCGLLFDKLESALEGHQVGDTLIGHEEHGIVKLDANHPLAGEALVFEIAVQAVRTATAAEIEQAKTIDITRT